MPNQLSVSPRGALALALLLLLQPVGWLCGPATVSAAPGSPPLFVDGGDKDQGKGNDKDTQANGKAGEPRFDLTTVPNDYFYGTRAPLEFKLVDAHEYDLVIFEVRATIDGVDGVVNGFRGVADMQRGGVRVISGDWMQKLPLGSWTISLSARGGKVTAEKTINVRTASLIEDATKPQREYVDPKPVTPEEEAPEFNLDQTLQDLIDALEVDDGLVEYKPLPDTRVIMVASGGDIAAGYEQLREGSADMLLLQAGGTYTMPAPILWAKSGRSAKEPLVITTYGIGPRPVIHTAEGFLKTLGGVVKHVAITNIDLVAATRDPASEAYAGGDSAEVAVHLAAPADDVRFQYVNFRAYASHVVVDDPNAGANATVKNLSFRRCLFVDAYPTPGGQGGHGIQLKHVDGLAIQGCTFDHNGWRADAGRAGLFHNALLQGVLNARVANNTFARECHTSLAVEAGEGLVSDNVSIEDNLFLDSFLPLGLAQDTPAGPAIARSKATGNVFLRTGGYCSEAPNGVASAFQNASGFDFDDNIFTDKNCADASPLVQPAIVVNDESPLDAVGISQNKIRWPKLNTDKLPIQLISDTSGLPLASAAIKLGDNYINIADSYYVDPTRDMKRYDELCGNDGSEPVVSFTAGARAQSINHYQLQHAAAAVVTYIKQGFAFKGNPPSPLDPVLEDPVVLPPPVFTGDDGKWSDLKPTGRVYYVSTSGDDNRDGLSPATAVRTLGRGYDLLRNGEGDWLLLRRGDVFDADGGFRNWKKSGRNAAAPLVVGAYGDSEQARPRIDSNGNTPLQMLHGQPVRHVRFMDLHLYANKRDPDSKDYDGGNGEEYGIQTRTPLEDVWFEGMLVEFFSNNVNIARKRDDGMVIRDLHFRRNVIRYSYNKQGHSQGLVMGSVQGPTYLIQNVFDHNGWNEKAGARRTQFNQNVYLNMLTNLQIEGNVFTRAAYSGLKLRSDIANRVRDVVVVNNVFIDNAVALQMSSDPTGSRVDVTVRNVEVGHNLFTRNGGYVDGKSVGLAMHLRQSGDLNIHDNLIVHKTVDTNWQAIGCGSSGPHGDINLARNIVYNWPNSRGEWLINADSSKISVLANLVNLPGSRFKDPNVTVGRYLQSIGMNDGQFYAALGSQSKGHWNDKLSAAAILDYFRDGFKVN